MFCISAFHSWVALVRGYNRASQTNQFNPLVVSTASSRRERQKTLYLRVALKAAHTNILKTKSDCLKQHERF